MWNIYGKIAACVLCDFDQTYNFHSDESNAYVLGSCQWLCNASMNPPSVARLSTHCFGYKTKKEIPFLTFCLVLLFVHFFCFLSLPLRVVVIVSHSLFANAITLFDIKRNLFQLRNFHQSMYMYMHTLCTKTNWLPIYLSACTHVHTHTHELALFPLTSKTIHTLLASLCNIYVFMKSRRFCEWTSRRPEATFLSWK